MSLSRYFVETKLMYCDHFESSHFFSISFCDFTIYGCFTFKRGTKFNLNMVANTFSMSLSYLHSRFWEPR